MIVGLYIDHYTLAGFTVELMVIDTEKIDTSTYFYKNLKAEMENDDNYNMMTYEDKLELDAAKLQLPCKIDHLKIISLHQVPKVRKKKENDNQDEDQNEEQEETDENQQGEGDTEGTEEGSKDEVDEEEQQIQDEAARKEDSEGSNKEEVQAKGKGKKGKGKKPKG